MKLSVAVYALLCKQRQNLATLQKNNTAFASAGSNKI